MLSALVIVSGAVILAVGAWGMVSPARLVAFLGRLRAPGALWALAAVRIGMGAVFVLAAEGSRWPTLLQAIGWLAIVAGLVTPFFGSARLARMLDWWVSRPPGFIRAWCAVALAIGGAIVFAGT